MGKIEFENKIHERLRGKKHLRPLFSNVYRIPERLRECDPDLFVVFNTKRQKYEVHSLGNIGSTFACDVPYSELDARVIEAVRRGNLHIRGPQIFKEIDEENERLEQSKERKRRADLMGIAEEMYPYFKPLGWGGV